MNLEKIFLDTQKEANDFVYREAEKVKKNLMSEIPSLDLSNQNITFIDLIIIAGHSYRVHIFGHEKADKFNQVYKDRIEKHNEYKKAELNNKSQST